MDIKKLKQVLTSLADSTRLRILNILGEEPELTQLRVFLYRAKKRTTAMLSLLARVQPTFVEEMLSSNLMAWPGLPA